MENTAYNKAWIFSWIFYIITIVCSILQYACFHFYNEKYHPMAMILEEFLEKEKIHKGNGDEITDVTEKQSEPKPSDNITVHSGHMSGIIGPQNDFLMSESKL